MVNWKTRVDVSDIFSEATDETFEADRDATVKRLRDAAGRIAACNHLSTDEMNRFHALVSNLEIAENDDQFDFIWNRIYDWCDKDNRVWLNTYVCFATKE